MEDGPWYSTTIFSQLNGQNFEDDLKTGCKYRYELMCGVDFYNKYNIPMHDYGSSGGGRQFPVYSSKEAFISLGQTIKFIDIWLQCFEENYNKKIVPLKNKYKRVI